MDPLPPRLVWLKLAVSASEIAEIATVVTDPGLEVVVEGPCLSIGVVSIDEAAEQTLRFLAQHCAPGTAPVCGRGVWKDRALLGRHMPTVVAHLHYRMIDVETVRELVRRWYPLEFQAPRVDEAPTAIAGIRASIEELRWYREHVVAPAPQKVEGAV